MRKRQPIQKQAKNLNRHFSKEHTQKTQNHLKKIFNQSFSSLLAQTVKVSAYNLGDPGLIVGSGRSPGEGNGNPLQYSCLENPMDGRALQVTVHGVAKSQTRLSDFTFTFFQFSCSVMSDSLRPHEPQHARPPCPSPIPGVHPNLCPSSR